jgi:hypothetical protein
MIYREVFFEVFEYKSQRERKVNSYLSQINQRYKKKEMCFVGAWERSYPPHSADTQ